MTFFLPETPAARPARPAPAEFSSFGDVVEAAATAEAIETDWWWNRDRTRVGIVNEIEDRIGRPAPGVESMGETLDAPPRMSDTQIREVLRRAGLFAAQRPGDYGDLPLDLDQLDAEATRRRKAELEEAQAALAMGGRGAGLAEFFGRAATAVSDPVSLGMLPLGGGGTSLARIAAREAALGAIGEAAILPRMYDVAEELDLPEPDALAQIALGAAGGAVLGAGPVAVLRGGRYVLDRTRGAAEAAPLGIDPLDAAAEVDAAEAALQSGRPAPAADLDAVAGRIIGIESGGNPAARNPASSATGAGQFIDSTWLAMIRRHRPDLAARRSDAQILAMRRDPAISREMTRAYAADNRALLAAEGLPSDSGALYLGHFLGPGGMVKAMRSAPDAPIGAVMSREQIAANRNVRFGGKFLPDFTAGDLRAWAAAKMSGAADPGGAWRGGTSRGYTLPDEVVTPSGIRVGVAYEVVDASSLLQASGRLQPRDRSRAASDEQIAGIAAGLDPARLMPSPEVDRGAPLVGPDNIIESGNGRVQAILRAAENHPDRFAAYVDAIAGVAEIPEGVTRPVLIARRTTELDAPAREALVRDANSSAIARMSATEQAGSDAAAIEPSVLGLYDPAASLGSQGNRVFTRAVLERLPQAERAALVDANGRLNAEGERRIRSAMFARAYEAPDLLRVLAELDGSDLKGVLEALSDVAPAWARLRAEVTAGEISAELDATPHLLDAIRLIAAARETAAASKGKLSVRGAIDDALAQGDMLAGNVDAVTAGFVNVFYKGNRARASGDVAAHLNAYVEEAMRVGSTEKALFADLDNPSARDILDAILDQEPDLFPAGRAGAGALDGEGGAGAPRPGDGDHGAGPGGGGGDAARAGDAATETIERPQGQAQSVDRLIAEGASPEVIAAHPDVQAAVDALAAVPRTDHLPGYGTDEFWSARKYRANGEEILGRDAAADYLHGRARFLAWTESGLTPPSSIGQDRRAVVLIGAPASGKSTVAEPLARAMKAAIVDPDEAKKIIPEYAGGLGANAVHEESSELAGDVLHSASLLGENLVLPKVGANPGSIERLVGELKADGYSVAVMHVDVAPDEAWRRMFGRWRSLGRIIPPEFMSKAIDGPGLTYKILKEKGLADGYAQIDNNPGRGEPRGIVETLGSVEPSDLGGMGSRPDARGMGGGTGARQGPGREGRAGGEEGLDPTPDIRGVDDAGLAEGATSPAAVAATDQALIDIEAFIEANGDFELADGAGGKVSARALLDDLAEDREFAEVVSVCAAGGRADA